MISSCIFVKFCLTTEKKHSNNSTVFIFYFFKLSFILIVLPMRLLWKKQITDDSMWQCLNFWLQKNRFSKKKNLSNKYLFLFIYTFIHIRFTSTTGKVMLIITIVVINGHKFNFWQKYRNKNPKYLLIF